VFHKFEKNHVSVIPAEAGIQRFQYILDPDFRRDDDFYTFYNAPSPIEILLFLDDLDPGLFKPNGTSASVVA
jgi:hypothetical protein